MYTEYLEEKKTINYVQLHEVSDNYHLSKSNYTAYLVPVITCSAVNPTNVYNSTDTTTNITACTVVQAVV